MPTIPQVSTLNASAVGIINAIRADASLEYQNNVPIVEATTESIRAAGQAITGYQPRANEFINALINRIALVLVTSRRYDNPLAFVKRGVLEYGETVEEIFVDIARAHPFQTGLNGARVFKKERARVVSSFHAMNSRLQYQVTISMEQLRTAFLSMDGVTDLIARLVDSLYSGAAYDEYIMLKFVIAQWALMGNIRSIYAPAVTDKATGEDLLTDLRSNVGMLGFMGNQNNAAGVTTFSRPEDLYTFLTVPTQANIDVRALAAAFNVEYADFIGRRIPVDSFAFNDGELVRLAAMLWDDPLYAGLHDVLPAGTDPTDAQLMELAPQIITPAQNAALATIQTFICDREWFMVFDNLPNFFTENWDGSELQWNEWLNVWQTYSASPFAQAIMFTSTESTVDSVTVAGPANVAVGGTYNYTANVATSGFAGEGVIWSADEGVNIDQFGRVVVSANTPKSFTVTATSAFDTSKTNGLSVTVA